jgi:hypothetical protein
MLTRLINRLFGGLTGSYERLDEQDIEKAIDILIEETDPRLRLVSGYKRKLRKPVIRSLVYVNYLVTRIPGAFEINRKCYGSNPQVSALFGAADDIDGLISRSRVLKNYFEEYPDQEVVYVPLAMNRAEKTVLGMELSGDIVRREVAQVAVNFSDHWLGICGSSESELRDLLRWRGIHNLAITALENITRLKMKTSELGEQRALLKTKLRNLQAQHRGLDALTTAIPDDAEDTQVLTRRLEEAERQLREAHARPDTLEDYLLEVCRVFNHPSRYLRVKRGSVRVDRMNIKVENESSDRGAEVFSAEIAIGNNPPFEAILALFYRKDVQQRQKGVTL